jgi:dimeric dUTPase (all-alpha-NTP-PPase superfamily)
LDEIGELTHELKAEWCWWKDTQPQVDRDRVLEELVDIWHFAMAWLYRSVGKGSWDTVIAALIDDRYDYSSYLETNKLTLILAAELSYEAFSFMKFLILCGKNLGFQIEDVYKAYLKKNQINYERLKAGY